MSLNEIKLIARTVYYEHHCGVKGYSLLKENQETGDTEKCHVETKFLPDLIILHKKPKLDGLDMLNLLHT